MFNSEYDKKVARVRYYRGDKYIGWQSYGWKMRYLEILNWLRSDKSHSVKIGRLTVSLENITDLPVTNRDFV